MQATFFSLCILLYYFIAPRIGGTICFLRDIVLGKNTPLSFISFSNALVTTASKNGLNLTVVTLSDSDTYDNHQSLYEDIFSRYQRYQVVDKNHFSIDQEFFDKEVYLKKSFYYPLTEDEVDNIKTVVRLLNSTGTDKVGIVEIYLNDQMIGKLPIFSKSGSENDNSNKFVKWFKSLF